jgi:diguanylate cyclase (GGDEF)-like protein/PAS domain S-box-containing protein
MLLTIAYVISGKLGLMLALPPGYTSPIFPPAGIAVAAVLIGGRKTLPWIFLGSLLLNIWVGYSSSQQINTMGLTVATLIAVASMLQAAIGGWGLRRVIGYPASLDHNGEVLRFLLLAPLICLTSASISVSGLMALGIIEPASFATNWAAWWVGDTLGVMVMLPLSMIIAGEPRALWQSRRRTVAVPMLLAFTLFVMIFLKANQWEYTDSLSDFRQLSQQAVNQVQNKLGEQETVLEEMAALFVHDADGHVTREEFHRFVEKSLFRFSMIQALEWASPVDAAHRGSFEAAQRKDFPGFEIRERNVAGQMQRAAERTSYYPVTYIEPLDGNEPAMGFDLASNPERRAALTEAIQSETAVITPAVRLMQEREQQTGVLLLLAVNPHKKESGTVLTVLRLGDFMDKLLLDTRPMLYTRLVDLEGQKTIYDNFAPGNQHALYEHTFNFGTRLYRLETAPTPAYFMQHHGWQSWSVLAAGVLGTGLLGAIFLLGTGYTTRIEAQVEDRTRRLKESESRFRHILENAPIGMSIASLDGRLIQVNQALCSMLGYEKNELEKLTFHDITHPEDLSLSLVNAQQLLDGKVSSYQFEKRYLRKDGQAVWAQIYSSIERDDSGAPLYFIVQIENITERKQAEELLRKSSEEIEDLYNRAPCGYHSLDKDGVIRRINDTELAWLGYTRDEVVGKIKWLDIVTPASQQTFRGNFPQFLKRGFVRDLEFEMIRNDGTTLIGLVSATAIYDPGGNFVMSRSMVFDITDRKQADQALKIENEKNLALLRNASDGIHILDIDGNIIDASDSFCHMLGYRYDEMIGMNATQWDALIPIADIPNMIRQQYESHTRSQFETLHRRKDGTTFDAEVSCFPLDLDGKPVMFYSSRDIAERKTAEMQIHKLAFYDALTQLPNRRLLNDRLGQTMAASKRSDRYGALMFLDLDNFKPLNDKYGHGVGDLLLIEAARRISRCVRETDTVARFGGDEFVVMLSELDGGRAESSAQAGIIAEKIRSTLAEPYLLTIQQEGKAEITIEHHCTSSIGVALFINHEASPEDILKWADMAMYQAKEDGRDSIRFFSRPS